MQPQLRLMRLLVPPAQLARLDVLVRLAVVVWLVVCIRLDVVVRLVLQLEPPAGRYGTVSG